MLNIKVSKEYTLINGANCESVNACVENQFIIRAICLVTMRTLNILFREASSAKLFAAVDSIEILGCTAKIYTVIKSAWWLWKQQKDALVNINDLLWLSLFLTMVA